jgi:iron complex outermembrane receptor protein
MKKIVALLTALGIFSFSFVSHAQTAVSGKVNGSVLSAQKPLESASISLLRAKDSSVAKLAVSDKSGGFEIENVKLGKYLLSVQSLGHVKYYSSAFDLSASSPNFTLANIDVKIASKELSAVTVVSQKPMIEQKIDRTIVNVEASVTNTGSNALEVLEKSPGITVDKDGNISLKGKAGVQVFIDGRPTYLSGQDLANMLRNMQSSQLDQLEIMTNPPAKYDAAGNSGIINIKTKKNKQVGYNGSATIGYGQGVYPKTNESVNMNYRTGKVNVFGNASYAYRERFQTLSIQRKFIDAVSKNVVSNFDQQNNLRNNEEPLSGKIGLDYFASKKTTLGVVFNGGNSNSIFTSRGAINISDPNYLLLSQTRAASDNNQTWKNFSTNFNLRQLLDTTGSEITADLDYIHYKSGIGQTITNGYYNASGMTLPGSRPDTLLGSLPQDISIYSVKVDYLKPLKKGARFEAGFKSSFVKTDNNAAYDSIRNNTIIHDYNRSNHFVYDENINAAYVNYSRPISKKINGQFGLRMEHTHSNGNQITTSVLFKRDYVQLFPTAYLQYQPNAKNSYVLNYGKRISRPDYADLNPFVTFLDRYTYQEGNPNLQPQFSHNIELSHTYNNFLTTTLNYTQTTDIIQDVLEQNTAKNESYIKKTNIANQRQFGLSVNAFFPITKWWTSNIYVNVYNNEFKGIVNGDYVTIGATTGMTNVMEQFKFKNGWGAEVSGFYRTEGVEGIFRIKGFGMMNLGLSKQVLKNKGSLRLSVRDALFTQKVKGETKFSNIDAHFQQFGESRVVNVSFTYRFSKGKVGNTQRKRGGASEEASRVKSGDSQ